MSKRIKRRFRVSAMLLGAGISLSAWPHHSQALFDMGRCISLSGTVHSFQFQFPHSWLWVKVRDAQAKEVTWGLESAAPAQMVEVEKRWRRDVVKKGDKVTVQLSPMRDGRPGGALATLTLPDGSTLRAATPACAKQLPPP